MSISTRTKATVVSLLSAMGLGGLVARRVARRHAAADHDDVTALAPAVTARAGPKPGASLLPCDTRSMLHAPGEIKKSYGSDTSETVEYRFNSAGYRSEELDPGAKLRILIVGESHALGNGVPFECSLGQRFKHHLAQALNWPEAAINVINLSVGGASADYCARTLLRQIDGVAPDLVLGLLPVADRIEDYTAKQAKNYKVSDIDIEEIENAPIPVQGFIDLYNVHFGRMNLAKNALLMQSICRLRGIESILVSEVLRPKNYQTAILSPVYEQLDQGRLLLHRFFEKRADLAADGMHAGKRTHEALAIRMLTRYAALLSADGQEDWGGRLSAHVERLKSESPDWAFVRQAHRR